MASQLKERADSDISISAIDAPFARETVRRFLKEAKRA